MVTIFEIYFISDSLEEHLLILKRITGYAVILG